MGRYEDVKLFAEMDLAGRKVLNGGSFTKLDGEVELGLGEGLQPFDPTEDAAAVELEQGEDQVARVQADDLLEAGSVACWESGTTLADAAEMAAEREAANDGWQESRYLASLGLLDAIA